MGGQVSITKLAGFLFFGFYFFHYGSPFGERSFPKIPRAMWWFLVFLAIDFANGFVFAPSELFTDLVASMFQFAQLIVFFWIGADLFKDERIAKNVLLAYTIVSSLFAVGIVLGIPGFATTGGAGRVTALHQDPNAVAANSVISIIIILGLSLYASHTHPFVRKLFLFVLSLPLLATVVLSGSRGGVLALFIGSMVYALPYRRSNRVLAAIFLSTFVVSALIYFVAKNPDFSERWKQTYYEGSLSGRQEIFTVAFEMILEQPFLGWQPVNYYSELGYRIGRRWTWRGRAVHNLILELLLETGILGAIPFLIGLWLCVRSAWIARVGNLGLLPVALLCTVLVCAMSGSTLRWKPQWFILALTLGAGLTNASHFGKRIPVVLVRQRSQNIRQAS